MGRSNGAGRSNGSNGAIHRNYLSSRMIFVYAAQMGESGSLANEPCVPVGQANWGQDKIRGTETTRLNVVTITVF